MKIIHTADLHLGQIIYQHYDRDDEHEHFFKQLEQWCQTEQPDALIVSGDVFDIQYPSAAVKKAFTDRFVKLHLKYPNMHIVITAGNHDSPSRIQADTAVWELANTHLIGSPPPFDGLDTFENWKDQYIIKLDSGYIVALPFMASSRQEIIQALLDQVAADNTQDLPVVMMAHQAVAGLTQDDIVGHDFDIGTLKMIDTDSMGCGYDYLALGHIHKPMTLDHREDAFKQDITYQAPVIRYSGSVLHVSCDENYPHSVSLVEIDKHQGRVHISQLRIDELRHFDVLPSDGTSFTSADDAVAALKKHICQRKSGYIRFRFDKSAYLPSDFNQIIYDILQPYDEEWRYNPKILWTGSDDTNDTPKKRPIFQMADLQQMTDPMVFIERTHDKYPDLDLEDVRLAFDEVRKEVQRISEEKQKNIH